MTLSISATAVKSWFQYRCERKFVYETMDRSARAAIPILEQVAAGPWADFGNEYETDVVAALIANPNHSVLVPRPNEDHLGERASLAFLRGDTSYDIAHQLVLSGTPVLAEHLGLEDMDVRFSRGLVDLVLLRELDGARVIRLVDIKSTHAALSFHKTQVAWYAWLLQGVLDQAGVDATIDEDADIWHRPPPGGDSSQLWHVTSFRRRPYQSVLLDWARGELRTAARRNVVPQRDETNFHIYFKCEQCRFLPHCAQQVADNLPPDRLDVSAVPGLSQQTKATLRRMRIRTVADFAGARGQILGGTVADWRLSTRGRQLLERADAIIERRVRRVPDHVTLRMPARSDVQVHLVADRDPMASRLATVGALVVEDHAETACAVRLIRSDGDEAGALREVLSVVLEALRRTDGANESGAQRILHFFVYENADSRDLAEALGRHLNDRDVVRDLLDLVRIFPSENTLPEPEYRGYHHLPACALREVLEDVYAIPVKVSYDLARVSAELDRLSPAPNDPYTPGEAFARRFSSRLGLSLCRDLADGNADEPAIEQDVEARLRAMAGLVGWLEDEDELLAPPDRFLRLRKAPFRLQASVDPLGARDLEILRAQALLANRSNLMSTLTRLAQPLERRQLRQTCISDMQLLRSGESPRGERWLLFLAPADAYDADIKPGDAMILLSDGHPDRVLDPAVWADLRVRLHPPRAGDQGGTLLVTMSEGAWSSTSFQELVNQLGDRGWVLDKGHFDINSDRLGEFLQHIDAGAP